MSSLGPAVNRRSPSSPPRLPAIRRRCSWSSLALVVLAVVLLQGGSGKHPARAKRQPAAAAAPAGARAHARSTVLSVRRGGRLPAPVQLPATASTAGGGAILAGGLSQADTSVASVVVAGRERRARRGLAAGGDPRRRGGHRRRQELLLRRRRAVARRDPRAAPRRRRAQRRPARRRRRPTSAAAIGDTAYLVGGYTGSVPLATIEAWSPGARTARVVGRLPKPLRYAAVAAAGGKARDRRRHRAA